MNNEREFKNLPEGWKWVRLGEVLKFLKGKTPRKLYDYEEEGMTIYLTPEYLRKNKCDVAFCKKEETLLANEDIIILWDGSNAGEVFWAEKGAVASTMAKIDINSSDYPIYKKFLYYHLKSNEFAFKYQVKGSGIPHFEKDILNTLNSIFPPLPEQQKIAEILETIDNAIEKTDKIIEKYKRIKQGLMQDLLTKGIDENGNIRDEKTHKFKDSPLGKIPEEWEVVRLGEVGKIITGSTPPTENSEYYGDEYLFVSPEDIQDKKYIENTTKKLTKLGMNIQRKISPMSICVVCIGSTIGKIAITKYVCSTNQQINTIIPNLKLYDPEALYYFINFHIQFPLKILAGLQAVPIVKKSAFSNILIPLPPLPEQQRIAEILSQIDQTIEKEEYYKEKLQKIKQGLMQDLLTGKVRVNHLVEEKENEQRYKSNLTRT